MLKNALRSLIFVISLILSGAVVYAADVTPSVSVPDQFVYDDTVTVEVVVSNSPGFIVIHADNGSGQPGPVIGYHPISPGTNTHVVVPLDVSNVTLRLFAMLHTDTGETGVYEYGTVEGADAPVMVNDSSVTQSFLVELISMTDQIVGEDHTVTAKVVTTQANGWLVIHADDGTGAPGGFLGQTFIPAGTSLDVTVTLEGNVTNALYPMLHTDTGEAEQYEFGTVDGVDQPVHIGERTAVTSLLTVPTVRVNDQIIIGSDATAASSDAVTVLRLDGVLSDGDGWLIVHAADESGNPGTVIGYGAVRDGYNEYVVVEMTTADVTPVIFPMLHEDTGEEHVYEFGEVDSVDMPVRVDGNIVVVPVNVAPHITYAGRLDSNKLTVASALIDGPGWLVIHADDGNGAPGEIIGYSSLVAGRNANITIELAEDKLTDTLYPMLHYDNGEEGVYEFGTVEGADGPVVVNGNIITGPLNPAIID